MRNVKILNAALWALNGLLGVSILAFAFVYLIDRPVGAHLEGFDPDRDPAPTKGPGRKRWSDNLLPTLPNPLAAKIEDVAAKAPSLLRATLRGTLPSEKNPEQGMAFIRTASGNVDLLASVGEPILHEGKPHPELTDWKLVEVYKNRAVFASGDKRETLVLKEEPPPDPKSSSGRGPRSGSSKLAGTPYKASTYKTRLLARAQTRQVYGVDMREVDWLAQNQQRILEQEIKVAPYAGGGLRVSSIRPGSIAAQRGLMVGDIIRDVNGIPLKSLADMQKLTKNPALQRSGGLRITLQRAGKPLVLEYRPLPR